MFASRSRIDAAWAESLDLMRTSGDEEFYIWSPGNFAGQLFSLNRRVTKAAGTAEVDAGLTNRSTTGSKDTARSGSSASPRACGSSEPAMPQPPPGEAELAGLAARFNHAERHIRELVAEAALTRARRRLLEEALGILPCARRRCATR